MSSAFPQSTGATVTSNGAYLYYQFTVNGTITIPYDVVCPVLLVGGGGGGGSGVGTLAGNIYTGGGGGSAGEMVYGNVGFQRNTVYNIGVGSGGSGATINKVTISNFLYKNTTSPTNGTNSSIFGGSVNIVANGGRAGGNAAVDGTKYVGGFGGNTVASSIYSGFVDSVSSFANTGSAPGILTIPGYYNGYNGRIVYTGGSGGASNSIWIINRTSYAAGGRAGTNTNPVNYTASGSGGSAGYVLFGTNNNPGTFVNGLNGNNGIVIIAFPSLSLVTRATFNSLPTFTPAGSIASYLGTTDPDGWVICDGVARTVTDARYTYVLAMGIGSGTANNYTPPDYRGAFLRGSGTNGTNSTYVGPTNGTRQTDDITSHTHTLTDPGHTHVLDVRTSGGQQTSFKTLGFSWNSVNNLYQTKTSLYYSSSVMCELGQNSILSSSSSLSIANYGDTETRPVNFGVNWILKL